MNTRKIACGIFATLLSLCWGCVASRGPIEIEGLGPQKKLPRVTQKIAVGFTNTSVSRDRGGQETPHAGKPVVEAYMLDASEYFLTVQSVSGEEDLYFKFKTVTSASELNLGSQALDYLYLGLSYATLTVIPYYNRLYRKLEVEVYQAGRRLKNYRYGSYYSQAAWLGLLPWWRFSKHGDLFYYQTEARQAVDHDLVNRFLVDLHRDFLPKPSPPKSKRRPAQKAKPQRKAKPQQKPK